MAAGTSSVKGAEDHRQESACLEGTHPKGQIPPLPSPSFPLCKKPISVWSEDYVWRLLTEDPQPCDYSGEGLEARSARMSMSATSSAKQSSEHLLQTRASASGSAMVIGQHSTTTTSNSSELHDTRTVFRAKNSVTDSPSQSPPLLVPSTRALSRPPPATLSTGIAPARSGHPQNSARNSSESPPSSPVIDLTAIDNDNIENDDDDFDKLFADVDMAQFEDSSTLSPSHDHGMTTMLKQDSKMQPLSSRKRRSSSMSSKQSDSRVQVHDDTRGGSSGQGALVPFKSQKEKASFRHRQEVEKSRVSSCPVCAVAFQPRYVCCTYTAYSACTVLRMRMPTRNG